MIFKKGMIVRFKKDYAYLDYCPHCGNEMAGHIHKDNTRTIADVTDTSIRLYEVNLGFDECVEYIEIVNEVSD